MTCLSERPEQLRSFSRKALRINVNRILPSPEKRICSSPGRGSPAAPGLLQMAMPAPIAVTDFRKACREEVSFPHAESAIPVHPRSRIFSPRTILPSGRGKNKRLCRVCTRRKRGESLANKVGNQALLSVDALGVFAYITGSKNSALKNSFQERCGPNPVPGNILVCFSDARVRAPSSLSKAASSNCPFAGLSSLGADSRRRAARDGGLKRAAGHAGGC